MHKIDFAVDCRRTAFYNCPQHAAIRCGQNDNGTTLGYLGAVDTICHCIDILIRFLRSCGEQVGYRQIIVSQFGRIVLSLLTIFDQPGFQNFRHLQTGRVPKFGIFLHHLDANAIQFARTIESVLSDIGGHGILVPYDSAWNTALGKRGVSS